MGCGSSSTAEEGQYQQKQQYASAGYQPGCVKCGKCGSMIPPAPGQAMAVTCGKCQAVNGVPMPHSNYKPQLGVQQAPMVGGEPPMPSGKRRALLIGCNYPGSSAQLNGCINDVKRMHQFLSRCGYPSQQVMMLTDDGSSPKPSTRQNIIEGILWLVGGASPGDCLFFHFSGHGAQEENEHNDDDDYFDGFSTPPDSGESDGMDETICPTDFQRAGMIIDNELFDRLCRNLPWGVKLTCVFDCCHSGTALDLPLVWDGGQWSTGDNPNNTAGDIVMISGCEDEQTSADAQGRYGEPAGAMTTALVDTLERNPGITYGQLLEQMHSHLKSRNHSQRPNLCSSQDFDPNSKTFSLVDGIVPNGNEQLGRQYRPSGNARRDYDEGDGLGMMLACGAGGIIGGVLLDQLMSSDLATGMIASAAGMATDVIGEDAMDTAGEVAGHAANLSDGGIIGLAAGFLGGDDDSD